MKLPELKQHFGNIHIPQTLKLSECETITDVPKMIDTHIQILESNAGRAVFMPYYLRLVRVKNLLK